MPVLDTKLNPRSADFQANAQAMRALVDDLRAQVAKVGQGGDTDASRAARKKHTERGKLLPRSVCLSLIHISEPTRPYSISYAVFCLKTKKSSLPP